MPNVRPGSLVITDLNTSAQVTPSGESFQTTTTGFSIEYTPSSDEESKTFIIDGGGIGNVNRTWVKTDDVSTYKYTFRFTGIKSDIKLSYGEYLQVGDYYFNDNTCSVVPTKSGGATCIGIVFHVGTGNGDDKKNYPEPILTNGIRGYAVALNDAGSFEWAKTKELGEAAITNSDENLFNGYSNTEFVKGINISDYLAFEECVNFQPAGNGCSGWYLPSAAQLKAVYPINSLLSNPLDSWYWSSTQKIDNSVIIGEKAVLMDFSSSNSGLSFIEKIYQFNVRPILTF